MSFFRRKLTCFYCGNLTVAARSNPQHPNGRVRQFTCPHCSADNHLDEHGEILDYIPEPLPTPPPQFTRRRTSPRHMRTLAPSKNSLESPPPSPTFCRTCINNQTIVNEAIKTYPLPPEDHPDYRYHVNVLFPRFKAEKEDRYPPVCAECAPKVNDRLRASNYQAKVASLGQMLARSSGKAAAKASQRNNGLDIQKMFGRSVWWIRGGLWCYSHFIMLAWHGTAMLPLSEVPSLESATWSRCITQSILKRDVDVSCQQVSVNHALSFVPWSALGIFWIYRELELQRNPDKKLVGAREYLRLEIVVYLFRLLSWWLSAPGGWVFTEKAAKHLHMASFFVFLMSTLFSLTCLKVEDPPKISLREPGPITGSPSPPGSPPRVHRQLPSVHQTLQSTSPVNPLPPVQKPPSPTIAMAAPNYSSPQFKDMNRRISTTPNRRALGTPGEPISPDAMDWDPIVPSPGPPQTQSFDGRAWGPSQHSQPPVPAFSRSSSAPQQLQQMTSLFSGTLPPAPRPPSHKLVSSLFNQNPAPSPAAKQLVREQFFSHRLDEGTAASPPYGGQWEKLSDPKHRLTNPRYPPMAQQKFFVPDESTGLEGLFGPGLKLDDDPVVEGQPEAEEGLTKIAIRMVVVTAATGLYLWAKGRELAIVKSVIMMSATWGSAWKVLGRWDFFSLSEKLLGSAISTGLLFSSLLQLPQTISYLPITPPIVSTISMFLLLSALTHEFWTLAIRLQHSRAREFYENERKKSLEEEKKARRISERQPASPSSSVDGSFASRATSPDYGVFGGRVGGGGGTVAGATGQNRNLMGAMRRRGFR